MIPCRSSNQRWQTTGLDSAFGIRQAETPRRGPPRPLPDEPSGETITPETAGGPGLDPCGRGGVSTGRKVRMARCLPACCEANRHEPVFPRSLRLSDRVSTSSPGAWETAGRRARVRKGPRSPSGPRPLRLRRQGRRHRRRRAPRHPRRFEGMSVRGRTMDRGTEACRRGEPAVPAPGGGSGQPCREWTKGSHSPGSRRAARRCSSREGGDWPGPAGRACTGSTPAGTGGSASAWTWPPPESGSRGTGGRRPRPARTPDAAVG